MQIFKSSILMVNIELNYFDESEAKCHY